MSDEKLAQSDIDALIAKVRGGNSNNAEPKNDKSAQFKELGITDKDLKGLEKLFKTSIEASSEVLQSVTQKDVSVDSITDIKITGRKTLSELIEAPYIATKVDYTVGLQGHDLLLMKMEDVKQLINLQFQMMGFTPDDTDSEFMMSASSELMNQMMGHASNKLGNALGIFIDISTPTTHIIEKNEDGSIRELSFLEEDESSYIYITFKLNVNGQLTGDLVKVLNTSFITELREIMDKNNFLGEDEVQESTETDNSTIEQDSQDDSNEESSNFSDETNPFMDNSETANIPEQQGMYADPMMQQQGMYADPMMQQQGMYADPMMQQQGMYADPMYQQPMYQQPMYQQPMYQQPMYQQPMYQQPMHEQHFSQNIVHDNNIDVKPYNLPNLTPAMNQSNVAAPTNRIKSVEVELTVELGRTRMTVKEILSLDKGSIIELSKLAGVTNHL